MSYNVVAKLVVGSSSDIESKVASYINTIPATKLIRSIAITEVGADRIYVLIVHDA